MAVGAIQGQSAMVGDTVALTVSSYFADPDGDRLLYDARSSDPGVATVSAAGDTVTVVAVRRGAAAITVTASDPDGLEASQPFEVTVPAGDRYPAAAPDADRGSQDRDRRFALLQRSGRRRGLLHGDLIR